MNKIATHPSSSLNHIKMDKTAFSVTTLFEKSNDKEYWLSKTPQERMQALEMMRQINYGYAPAIDRMEKVLEIVQLAPDYIKQTNEENNT